MIVLCVTHYVYADGVFFANRTKHLHEPEQKAIIYWDGQKESMILSAKVASENIKDLSRMVWLIPLESLDKPEVTPSDISMFKAFVDYFKPKLEWGKFKVEGAAVLEVKKIDIYDVVILKVTQAEELVEWLNNNGYVFPDSTVPVIKEYINNGIDHFIANKINLENKFGPTFQEIEILVDNIITNRDNFNVFVESLPMDMRAEMLSKIRLLRRDWPQHPYSYIAKNRFIGILSFFRRSIIMSILKGISFEDSVINTEFGKMLNLLSNDQYNQLLKTCRLKNGVYEKISLYDGWSDFLMGDYSGGVYYGRKSEFNRYQPNLKVMAMVGRRGIGYGGGRVKIGFDSSLERKLRIYSISVENYRKFLENNLYEIQEKYKKVFNSLNFGKLIFYLDVLDEIEDLSCGVATPLKIDFYPSRPIYPLRISAMNTGKTKIEVYFCAQYPVEDSNSILKIDDVKVIPHRIRKRIKPYLDLNRAKFVTRLSYEGKLSGLTNDTVFRKSSRLSPEFDEIKRSEDEMAFERIFAKDRPEEQLIHEKTLDARKKFGKYFQAYGIAIPLGKYSDQEIEEMRAREKEISELKKRIELTVNKELQEFVKKYPKSRFADDAVMISLLTKLWDAWGLSSLSSVSAEQLHQLYNQVSSQVFNIENFSLLENPILERAKYYEHKGVAKEYMMSILAGLYKREKNFTVAGNLAQQIISSLSMPEKKKLVEKDEELKGFRFTVEDMLPKNLSFERYLEKGVVAYDEKDWAVAEKMFEKAISLKKDYRPYPFPPGPAKTLPTAYYLLGNARIMLDKYRQAREAFEKMIEIAPKYRSYLRLEDRKVMFHIDTSFARAHIAFCYLREGKIDQGLEEGLEVLQIMRKEIPGAEDEIALVHYNIACAYALKGDKPNALKHIKESLNLNPSLTTKMLKDEDFKILYGDKGFEDLFN